jgi:hypothetical protein
MAEECSASKSTIRVVKKRAVGSDPAAATPLPATWTLLLAGIFGLGFVARANRRGKGALAC